MPPAPRRPLAPALRSWPPAQVGRDSDLQRRLGSAQLLAHDRGLGHSPLQQPATPPPTPRSPVCVACAVSAAWVAVAALGAVLLVGGADRALPPQAREWIAVGRGWLASVEGRAAAAAAAVGGGAAGAECPGTVMVGGYGAASIVPAGWNAGGPGAPGVQVLDGWQVSPRMGGRAYLASACTAGTYNRSQYLSLSLLGKRMRYTTDLSGAGCGCNAALTLLPIAQNDDSTVCGDHYCDASASCGVACAEIGVQEANRYAWHSTLHSQTDREGVGAGYGGGGAEWSGPRDWKPRDYAPGSACINTSAPFQVDVAFPVDDHGFLLAVQVTLTQGVKGCSLPLQINTYEGMSELSATLARGVTPVVSYWSEGSMLWLDGKGNDGLGPCDWDDSTLCASSVQFYDFSVEALPADAAAQSIAAGLPAQAAEGATPAGSAPVATFDCTEVYSSWQQSWSDAKKEWCCLNAQLGCKATAKDVCPGTIDVGGYGQIAVVPTGWGTSDGAAELVEVRNGMMVAPKMGSRLYFADSCTAGVYSNDQYLAVNLLNKTFRYVTDMSGAGCGCNAALYLTSMRQNANESTCGDYYCDAYSACGVACAEIDIQEGNQYAWHSTLHASGDASGVGGGYGGGGPSWSGPRHWSLAEYAPGAKCIDTSAPFEVAASFPADSSGLLLALEVTLSQAGHSCPLELSIHDYESMPELSRALAAGMTPTISYWSDDDMLWMDGKGADSKGPCAADNTANCADSVKFYGFSIEPMSERPAPASKGGKVHPIQNTNSTAPTADFSSPEVASTTAQQKSLATCPGDIEVEGYGNVSLVPTGWGTPAGVGAAVDALKLPSGVAPHMGGRAYFADACTAGEYRREQYVAPKLLGKTLTYTTDVSGAGCGCNAALYLVSMRHSEHAGDCGDYYCDANNVCGQSCAEIDIQEGNMHSWHSTLHTADDPNGVGAGYGGGGDEWSGPRDWKEKDYGLSGKCVDTQHPFQVAVSFPTNHLGTLRAMEVNLSQALPKKKPCSLTTSISIYTGMGNLSEALAAGMTPVVSYWSSDDMLWMDGVGKDHKGPCKADNSTQCAESVSFFGFSIRDYVEPASKSDKLETSKPKGSDHTDTVSDRVGEISTNASQQALNRILAVHMTVKGVDYERLTFYPAVQSDFENEVKTATAKEAGVKPSEAKVALFKGSVQAVVMLDVPHRVEASGLCSRLTGSSTLSASVAAAVQALPDLNLVLDGTNVSVSGVIADQATTDSSSAQRNQPDAVKPKQAKPEKVSVTGSNASVNQSATEQHSGSKAASSTTTVIETKSVAVAQTSVSTTKALAEPECPGTIEVVGYGEVSLVPTGWNTPAGVGAPVDILEERRVAPQMGARAYFADTCTAGAYDNQHYIARSLLGRRLRYTTDVSGAGCGCNAAFYLVSMRQNDNASECGDHYCDANNVCGQSCAEIDIQEGNMFSWHSTLHSADDPSGVGGGYGGGGKDWSGPRDWTSEDYGPGGRCIDTRGPFNVSAYFFVGSDGNLSSMNVTLSQKGRPCVLSTEIPRYRGMAELSRALRAGMTPVVSYWSADDMLWMDGRGKDLKGACRKDKSASCGESVKFYDFSIQYIDAQQAVYANSSAKRRNLLQPHHGHHRLGGKFASPKAEETTLSTTNMPWPPRTSASASDTASISATETTTPAPTTTTSAAETTRAAQQTTEAASTSAKRAHGANGQLVACRGAIQMGGHGNVTVADASDKEAAVEVKSAEPEDHRYHFSQSLLRVHADGRALMTSKCQEGHVVQAVALNLIGNTLRYSVDLSAIGCGGSVSLRLQRGDTTADVMVASAAGWRSSVSADKKDGKTSFANKDFGPNASCIDTNLPFHVAVSFPINETAGMLTALEVALSQHHIGCQLTTRAQPPIDPTTRFQLAEALSSGVTPIFHFAEDKSSSCSKSDSGDNRSAFVTFTDFAIQRIEEAALEAVAESAVTRTSASTSTMAQVKATTTEADTRSPLLGNKAHKDSDTKSHKATPVCPGNVSLAGYGAVSIVPTGWGAAAGVGAEVAAEHSRKVVPRMGGRAYFADSCTAGVYEREQYVAPNLLGKTLRYSVDLSKAGCGCNAALYLVSMRQNKRRGTCEDFYCDANSVCGEACAEIDLQEANRHSWHSTLHGAKDPDGVAAGFGGGGKGWNGPRDWNASEYGPDGRCVDTSVPFDVSASFPVDGRGSLRGMQVTLAQPGRPCNLTLRLHSYKGMEELGQALKAGMTPVISYWSNDDMLWMDGQGDDHKGPCKKDVADKCGESVEFLDFSISDIAEAAADEPKNAATAPAAPTVVNDKAESVDAVGPNGEKCPGSVQMDGYGKVQLVPTGWLTSSGGADVTVTDGKVVPFMNARAYFADVCTAGAYDRRQYLAPKLLGQRMRYTVDISGAGCGCNAAFYLTSMRQNEEESECHDFYCDANKVCGEACAEIDIQEANQFSWHSTLHTATDADGVGAGYGGGGDGWNGPRDWTADEYGPGGKCIDTDEPFQVEASFPVDAGGLLLGMQVTLSQEGQLCHLSVTLDKYDGLAELSKALAAGMTPVLSYWSDDDMLWMDGMGKDSKGACKQDSTANCGESVKFYDFALESLDGSSHTRAPARGMLDAKGADLIVQAKVADVPPSLAEGESLLIGAGKKQTTAQILEIARARATGVNKTSHFEVERDVIEEHKWRSPILRPPSGGLARPLAMAAAAMLTFAIALAAAAWPRAWRRLGSTGPEQAAPTAATAHYARLDPDPDRQPAPPRAEGDGGVAAPSAGAEEAV